MLQTLFASPLFFLVLAAGLVLAITIHEFAHAWMADRLGDPTPRSQARLTLDPRSHLDPLGTIALLVVGFGWGRLVQFDPYNLRNPLKDSAIIALAGPVSNIILAIILSVAMRFFGTDYTLSSLLFTPLIVINISLAIFNLVPIYPLDGEKIASAILPHGLAREYATLMHQYGTIILILMLLPIAGGTSPISALISPIIAFVGALLL